MALWIPGSQEQSRPDCAKLLSKLMLAYLTKEFEFFSFFYAIFSQR